MKKTIFAISIILASALATQAIAADDLKIENVGVAYGLGNGGVLSAHADVDISDMTNKPLMARFGYDQYSIDTSVLGSSYAWAYNVFYAGAYYDLSKVIKLPEEIRPFAGLGFGFGFVSCSGTLCNNASSPTVGGFYYIGGVQYKINRQFDAEFSLSGWGGLSVGANYLF